jgi:hypothetical protein
VWDLGIPDRGLQAHGRRPFLSAPKRSRRSNLRVNVKLPVVTGRSVDWFSAGSAQPQITNAFDRNDWLKLKQNSEFERMFRRLARDQMKEPA